MRGLIATARLLTAAALFGCGGGGEPAQEEMLEGGDRAPVDQSPATQAPPDQTPPLVEGPIVPTPQPPSTPTTTTQADVEIPVDSRAVAHADVPVLPVIGGTLVLDETAERAIAADPERNLIAIVDVFREELIRTIALEPGDEPARLVVDGERVHVVLRGADQIATIDLNTDDAIWRRNVCRAPRGIALDDATGLLHVACATGGLWTFAVDGDTPNRQLDLGPDLRDVLVDGTRLLVTRFKSAELIELDPDGNVVSVQKPNSIFSTRGIRATPVAMPLFTPNGAFRTVLTQDGTVMMLHQRALTAPITLDPGMPGSLNGYYGGTCGGIVESTVTAFRPDGTRSVIGSLSGTLAVDVAMADNDMAFVAFAGSPDPDAPRPAGILPPSATPVTLVQVTGNTTPTAMPPVTCAFGSGDAGVRIAQAVGQVVAVAQRADGQIRVAQSREPAGIQILSKPGGVTQPLVEYSSVSVRDTGHELFHRSPNGGVTCASCHLEGGDDGHTWNFDPLGARRTQASYAGLAGTAPFHWDGDMETFEALLDEVMVVRMGGVHQSPERIAALEDFQFGLMPPTPVVTANDDAAERGRVLFESEQVGCSDCHSGASFTNNENQDVGTGGSFQVPPLRGIGYRAPFMHDGCAQTLHDRFDPRCGGGEKHGSTADLTASEIDDLIAYLNSL